MRLNKIKLAGFKSFVEPTSVLLLEPVVGVVGPNGCGKSNLVDAVRWVLGESRASALRGESMKDVIFNGSANRKPVGRASVELVFDNSDGKAAGPWNQYGEIAVSRWLDGDSTSTYAINGTTVRRRDVVDLFLGTGLGPKAYAIIEQGMISRIIEAKPEDMRVFLEEAAGVSKYKERRRETEGRLKDAQSNLLRIADILTTLHQQLNKLEQQAATAQRYVELQTSLQQQQQRLWVLKLNRAAAENRSHHDAIAGVQVAVTELHSRIQAQEQSYTQDQQALAHSQQDVEAMQSRLAVASETVVRLTAEADHQRQDQLRLQQQDNELQQQQQAILQQIAAFADEVHDAETQAARIKEESTAQTTSHQHSQDRLPALQQATRKAEAHFLAENQRRADLEKKIQLEETRIDHTQRTLTGLQQRRDALTEECQVLTAGEGSHLQDTRQKKEAAERLLHQARSALDSARLRQEEASHQLEQNQATHRQMQTRFTQAQAHHQALVQMQARLATGDGAAWLEKHGLAQAQPLWRHLQVSPGWELALEAALQERMGALTVSEAQLHEVARAEHPSTSITLLVPIAAAPSQAPIPEAETAGGWRWLSWLGFGKSNGGAAHAASTEQLPMMSATALLRTQVRCDEPWRAVVDRLLDRVYVCEDVRDLLPQRAALDGLWVDRLGHTLTAHSLSFHVPDEITHGVLERQREIEALALTLAQLQGEQNQEAARLNASQQTKKQQDEAREAAEQQLQRAQAALQQLQVELVRLEQQQSDRQARLTKAQQELSLLAEQIQEEESRHQHAKGAQASAAEQLVTCARLASEAQSALQQQRLDLQQATAAAAEAAQRAQAAELARRDTDHTLQRARENLERARDEQAQQQQLAAEIKTRLTAPDSGAKATALQQAKDQRERRNAELTDARQRHDERSRALRSQEELRLKLSKELGPLQEKIASIQLKAQAAAMVQEQCLQRLDECGGTPSQFSTEELAALKESALQNEVGRLRQEMESLGAVNQAAVEELNDIRAQHDALQKQDEDLRLAVETLIGAIASMDKETKDQLQETFHKINHHFSHLFPNLFGGGSASLSLMGDDILQAGVVVHAQPPGKKNSTIHLLSGGEKALTALSLVFSIFQLNPAPFCVLDEVDAPLDEVNTGRFTRLLQDMSAHTQFIVVTHNRLTMELSKRLVGVTMREPGVSRVVEVDVLEALRMQDEQAA